MSKAIDRSAENVVGGAWAATCRQQHVEEAWSILLEVLEEAGEEVFTRQLAPDSWAELKQ